MKDNYKHGVVRINEPADNDIVWHVTKLTKILRHFNFKRQHLIAEYLVNVANGLRMASPKDGYEWVDRRKSAWSQMDDTQKVREIKKSLDLEALNHRKDEHE